MMHKTGRRLFLLQSGWTAAAALGGAAAFAGACGGKKTEALKCTDTSELNEVAVQTRKSLNYVDKSPKAEQNCANCRFFQSKGEQACGGCTLIQGPINPAGWCNSWAAKEG